MGSLSFPFLSSKENETGRSGQLTIRATVSCQLAKSENNPFLLIMQKAVMVYMSLALLSMAGVTIHKSINRAAP